MEATVIAALIAVVGTLIGIIYQGFRSNKQDKGQFELLKQENKNLKERIEERHTSGKAEEYHNLETKDIQETRSDIKEAKSSIGIVFTDVKLLSKDFNNYQNSIKQADSSEGAISIAIKSIENLAVNTGALKEENMMLKTENSQCLNQLNLLNRKYETILEENKALKQQIEKLMNSDRQKEFQKNKDITVECDKDMDNRKEQSYEENEREDDFELER